MRLDHCDCIRLCHRHGHQPRIRIPLHLPANPSGKHTDPDGEQRAEQEEQEGPAEQDGAEIAPRDDAGGFEA